MRRLAEARQPVAAAWLTRGGLHGGRREAESRQAMKLIGVDSRNLFFFRLVDGHALDFIEEIVTRLERLFSELRPASIFVPAFEGGHPDHDAVQLAAAAALSRLSRQQKITGEDRLPHPMLLEYPLYTRAGAKLLKVGSFIPANVPTKQTPMKLKDRLFKRKVAITFSSQRAILWPLTGLRGGPMMVHVKGEPYRRVPRDRDYTMRPHRGRLAYEYFTRARFPRFAAVAARLLP